jgi:hypothetical protein
LCTNLDKDAIIVRVIFATWLNVGFVFSVWWTLHMELIFIPETLLHVYQTTRLRAYERDTRQWTSSFSSVLLDSCLTLVKSDTCNRWATGFISLRPLLSRGEWWSLNTGHMWSFLMQVCDSRNRKLAQQAICRHNIDVINDEHNRIIILVLTKHEIAPWWWFLHELKHVGAIVGILIVFNIPMIL